MKDFQSAIRWTLKLVGILLIAFQWLSCDKQEQGDPDVVSKDNEVNISHQQDEVTEKSKYCQEVSPLATVCVEKPYEVELQCLAKNEIAAASLQYFDSQGAPVFVAPIKMVVEEPGTVYTKVSLQQDDLFPPDTIPGEYSAVLYLSSKKVNQIVEVELHTVAVYNVLIPEDLELKSNSASCCDTLIAHSALIENAEGFNADYYIEQCEFTFEGVDVEGATPKVVPADVVASYGPGTYGMSCRVCSQFCGMCQQSEQVSFIVAPNAGTGKATLTTSTGLDFYTCGSTTTLSCSLSNYINVHPDSEPECADVSFYLVDADGETKKLSFQGEAGSCFLDIASDEVDAEVGEGVYCEITLGDGEPLISNTVIRSNYHPIPEGCIVSGLLSEEDIFLMPRTAIGAISCENSSMASDCDGNKVDAILTCSVAGYDEITLPGSVDLSVAAIEAAIAEQYQEDIKLPVDAEIQCSIWFDEGFDLPCETTSLPLIVVGDTPAVAGFFFVEAVNDQVCVSFPSELPCEDPDPNQTAGLKCQWFSNGQLITTPAGDDFFNLCLPLDLDDYFQTHGAVITALCSCDDGLSEPTKSKNSYVIPDHLPVQVGTPKITSTDSVIKVGSVLHASCACEDHDDEESCEVSLEWCRDMTDNGVADWVCVPDDGDQEVILGEELFVASGDKIAVRCQGESTCNLNDSNGCPDDSPYVGKKTSPVMSESVTITFDKCELKNAWLNKNEVTVKDELMIGLDSTCKSHSCLWYVGGQLLVSSCGPLKLSQADVSVGETIKVVVTGFQLDDSPAESISSSALVINAPPELLKPCKVDCGESYMDGCLIDTSCVTDPDSGLTSFLCRCWTNEDSGAQGFGPCGSFYFPSAPGIVQCEMKVIDTEGATELFMTEATPVENQAPVAVTPKLIMLDPSEGLYQIELPQDACKDDSKNVYPIVKLFDGADAPIAVFKELNPVFSYECGSEPHILYVVLECTDNYGASSQKSSKSLVIPTCKLPAPEIQLLLSNGDDAAVCWEHTNTPAGVDTVFNYGFSGDEQKGQKCVMLDEATQCEEVHFNGYYTQTDLMGEQTDIVQCFTPETYGVITKNHFQVIPIKTGEEDNPAWLVKISLRAGSPCADSSGSVLVIFDKDSNVLLEVFSGLQGSLWWKTPNTTKMPLGKISNEMTDLVITYNQESELMVRFGAIKSSPIGVEGFFMEPGWFLRLMSGGLGNLHFDNIVVSAENVNMHYPMFEAEWETQVLEVKSGKTTKLNGGIFLGQRWSFIECDKTSASDCKWKSDHYPTPPAASVSVTAVTQNDFQVVLSIDKLGKDYSGEDIDEYNIRVLNNGMEVTECTDLYFCTISVYEPACAAVAIQLSPKAYPDKITTVNVGILGVGAQGVNCDDGNACTQDVCNNSIGCVHLLSELPESEECEIVFCDSKTGDIVKVPDPSCDD